MLPDFCCLEGEGSACGGKIVFLRGRCGDMRRSDVYAVGQQFQVLCWFAQGVQPAAGAVAALCRRPLEAERAVRERLLNGCQQRRICSVKRKAGFFGIHFPVRGRYVGVFVRPGQGRALWRVAAGIEIDRGKKFWSQWTG